MCFGNTGGSSTSSSSSSMPDTRAFFSYWRPPKIDSPTFQLNEDATKKKLKSKRTGTSQLQIPLVPNSPAGGLAIPTQKEGRRY